MKRITVALILGFCLFSLRAAAQAVEAPQAGDWNQVWIALGTLIGAAALEIGRRWIKEYQARGNALDGLSAAVNLYRQDNEQLYLAAIAKAVEAAPELAKDPAALALQLQSLADDLKRNSIGKRIESTVGKGSPVEIKLREVAAKNKPVDFLQPKSKTNKNYPNSIAGT